MAGGHALVYQRLRRLLDRGHDVGVVAFGALDHPADDDPLYAQLADLVLVPEPARPHVLVRMLDFMVSPIPAAVRAYRSPVMMRRVGDLVHEGGYDLVVAEFSAMGQYLYRNPYLPAVRTMISCHFNLASTLASLARTRGFSPLGLRSRVGLDSLQRYELNMYRSVDRVLVLTQHDRYGLLEADPTLRVEAVPCGVDASWFRPPVEDRSEEALVFTGQYEVETNLDAVRWFTATCWPLIKARRPGLRFYIVGPGAGAELAALAAHDDSITVTGEVDDVRPYLHRARLFVCPVRHGSGLKFKVLEAMASGVPVVSTSRGAEGIPMQNGDTGFLADKPEIMAECIDLLLGDESLRGDIARQARTLVADRFDWNHVIDRLESVMRDTLHH
jgi:glycosyltransferase involved in cell wall biosynthesis